MTRPRVAAALAVTTTLIAAGLFLPRGHATRPALGHPAATTVDSQDRPGVPAQAETTAIIRGLAALPCHPWAAVRALTPSADRPVIRLLRAAAAASAGSAPSRSCHPRGIRTAVTPAGPDRVRVLATVEGSATATVVALTLTRHHRGWVLTRVRP